MNDPVIDKAHLTKFANEIFDLCGEQSIDTRGFVMNLFTTREFYQSIKLNFPEKRLIDQNIRVFEGLRWSMDIMYFNYPAQREDTPQSYRTNTKYHDISHLTELNDTDNPQKLKLRVIADRLSTLFDLYGLEYKGYLLVVNVTREYYEDHKGDFGEVVEIGIYDGAPFRGAAVRICRPTWPPETTSG